MAGPLFGGGFADDVQRVGRLLRSATPALAYASSSPYWELEQVAVEEECEFDLVGALRADVAQALDVRACLLAEDPDSRMVREPIL